MLLPLEKVVVWKARATPGERIIPAHLKLAILSRGRILVPAANVKWLLELAVQNGATWPQRLQADLAQIIPKVPVTIELFFNQRPTMTEDQIDTTLQAYLALRHKQHLPQCHLLLFAWGTNAKRRQLEQLLGVDFTRLYSRPRVRVGPNEDHRYILLAYACLPAQITRFIAPEPKTPVAPPPPTQRMPPLAGLTSVTTERNLRKGPTTSSESLGEQTGHAIGVRVLDKAEKDDFVWYQIELGSDLAVKQGGKPAVLPAGTVCWLVNDGLDYVAAPWDFFRHQLIQFENENAQLSLDDRITKLRQISHRKNIPFDVVIGTGPGSVYLDDRQFDPRDWQILKDYQAVRAPDGRIVDLHHLVVGLDVLHRQERGVTFSTIFIGTNYAAATWSGDLGSAAAEMTLKQGKLWEKRNPKATFSERADYYMRTRAAEWDLLGDLDAWGITALRTPERPTIDALVASYYENTTPGGQRTLVEVRRQSVELFLAHYGFTYEYARDISDYPVLPKQSTPARRIRSETDLFGRMWLFFREPIRLASRDENKKRPAGQDVAAMAQQFLFWLEYAAIEHGAEVAATP